jgi:hypothetical protein
MTTKPVLTLDGEYEGYQFIASGNGVTIDVKVPGRQWAERISWLNPPEDLRAMLPTLKGTVRVTYTESNNTTKSGNPYKDGVEVTSMSTGEGVSVAQSQVDTKPVRLGPVAPNPNSVSIESNSSMQAAAKWIEKAFDTGKIDPADFDTVNTAMLTYTEIAMRALQSVKGITYSAEESEE